MKRQRWKDKDFKSADPWLHYVPKELAEVRWRCEQCSGEFPPPWTDKTFPRGPVAHKDGGWWASTSFQVPCPYCKAEVWFDIPHEEPKGQYRLFGDEAYRDIGEHYLINYSLVGCNVDFLPKFDDQIRTLKTKFSPDRDPDTWSLHMKELWAGASRARHPIFSKWTDSQRHELVEELFDFVGTNRPELYVANISALFRKPGSRKRQAKTRDYVKKLAFAQFLMRVISDHTAYGIQPFFIFDTEKYDGVSKSFVQQWARESFFGSQVCILYPFLTRGIYVPEPTFVAPASEPLLELADFVAYVISRSIDKTLSRQTLDLNSSELGVIEYFGFSHQDQLVRVSQIGVPFEQFFAFKA